MPLRLDPRYFPHIFAEILTLVDYQTLLSARAVCSAMRQLVDEEFTHLPDQTFSHVGEEQEVRSGLYRGPNRRVPGSWANASLKSRASAIRRVTRVLLDNVPAQYMNDINRLLQRLPATAGVSIYISHTPFGFRLPAIRSLMVNVPSQCQCIVPEERIEHQASTVTVLFCDYGDPRVTKCKRDTAFARDVSRLNGIINRGVKYLVIDSDDSPNVLEYFGTPSLERHSDLRIHVVTQSRFRLAFKNACAERFDIPLEQVTVSVPDGESDDEDDI